MSPTAETREVFECADNETLLLALAPHARMEPGTGAQARAVADSFSNCSYWLYEARTDTGSAFETYHTSSTQISEYDYHYLSDAIDTRPVSAISFHGFNPPDDETDIYVGGRAPEHVRELIARLLSEKTGYTAIAAVEGDGLYNDYGGRHVLNVLNRASITPLTIQLEQRRSVRTVDGEKVAEIATSALVEQTQKLLTQ